MQASGTSLQQRILFTLEDTVAKEASLKLSDFINKKLTEQDLRQWLYNQIKNEKDYRKLAITFHPDVNKDFDTTEAFKILGNV